MRILIQYCDCSAVYNKWLYTLCCDEAYIAYDHASGGIC